MDAGEEDVLREAGVCALDYTRGEEVMRAVEFIDFLQFVARADVGAGLAAVCPVGERNGGGCGVGVGGLRRGSREGCGRWGWFGVGGGSRGRCRH